jgi:hypothetical protein
MQGKKKGIEKKEIKGKKVVLNTVRKQGQTP